MPLLANELEVERCPQCQVAKPRLSRVWSTQTSGHSGGGQRYWAAYLCASCGGVTLGEAPASHLPASRILPEAYEAPSELPPKARAFLAQAADSLHAPAGAVILAGSAVDAMLKAKNYSDGSLKARINAAVEAHLLTTEMGAWAHQVRLDSNDQRHADEAAELPTEVDARHTLEFAKALATYLFVLPSRVAEGLRSSQSTGGT